MKIIQKKINIVLLSLLFILSSKAQTENYSKEFERIVQEFSPQNYNSPMNVDVLDSTSFYDIYISAKKKDAIKAKQNVLLVFLKLYYSHLKCCNQSYELRSKPHKVSQALHAYLEIKGVKSVDTIDVFLSSDPYEWLITSKELPLNDDLKLWVNRIDRQKKRISSE